MSGYCHIVWSMLAPSFDPLEYILDTLTVIIFMTLTFIWYINSKKVILVSIYCDRSNQFFMSKFLSEQNRHTHCNTHVNTENMM